METKTEKNESEKMPSNFSKFDGYVIKCVGCLVPGQTSKLVDGEGHVYVGTCKKVFTDENDGGLAIASITKDEKTLVRIVYDYETYEEVTFYGDKNGK